jgi:hypothetical protein
MASTFNAEDLNRIRRVLGIPVAYQEYLKERMNTLQAFALGVAPSNQITPVQALSQDAVAEIQAALNEWETLDATIAGLVAKDGLIKAGELQWAGAGGRTMGLRTRQETLKFRIVAALDINTDFTPLIQVMGQYSGGGSGLGRS